MLHRRRWAVGVVLALLLTLALPSARAQTEVPTIQTDTPTVGAGGTASFTGGGFARGERVATWATAPDQTVFGGSFFYAARADGSVALTFTVPGDALGGRWALTAYGDRSKAPAVAFFEVQGSAPGETPPQATVEPPTGPPGTEFRFNAYGFRDNERVSYWITGPDGKVFDAYPDKKEANNRGKVSLQWTVPADAPRGVWVLTIQGIKSNRAKGIRFEVQ